MNSPEKREDGSPPRRSRSEMDAHERRLWDLDDGDDLLADDDLQEFEGEVEMEEDSAPPSDSEIQDPSELPPAPDPEEFAQEEDPEERESTHSSIEKISLSIFGVLILALAAWFLFFFLTSLPTEDPVLTADFPVKGKSIVVEDVTTYWRKPKASDGRVRSTAKVIPAGLITLKGSEGRGALRVLFEDDQGDLTGDTYTVAVSGGKFSPGGKNSIEVICSDGLSDLGDLPGYLTGQIEFWHLIVLEGPSPDARGREFEEILRLPIARQRR